MAVEDMVRPITPLGLHEDVPPLAVVGKGEWIVAYRQVERVALVERHLTREVDRRGGPTEQVGLDGPAGRVGRCLLRPQRIDPEERHTIKGKTNKQKFPFHIFIHDI